MKHKLSPDDRELHKQFVLNAIEPARFHHREHLRLAYIFLVEYSGAEAYEEFRDSLQSFLQHNGIDPAKYHATLTRAWMLAVLHFMEMAEPQTSSDDFIRNSAALLDPKIMLTHYSKDMLTLEPARDHFVQPDIQPIPRHFGMPKLQQG
jgi:hypothetical protein